MRNHIQSFLENTEKFNVKFNCIDKDTSIGLNPITNKVDHFKQSYFTTIVNNRVVSSCLIHIPIHDKYVKLIDVKSRKTSMGYGSLLIQKLKEYLKSIGINQIYLGCSKNNLGAQKFYEREGFKNIGDFGSDTYLKYLLKF